MKVLLVGGGEFIDTSTHERGEEPVPEGYVGATHIPLGQAFGTHGDESPSCSGVDAIGSPANLGMKGRH